jgi:hypothetical protein
MHLDHATFDVLAKSITAIDFIDKEIPSSSKETQRPLRMVRRPLAVHATRS